MLAIFVKIENDGMSVNTDGHAQDFQSLYGDEADADNLTMGTGW